MKTMMKIAACLVTGCLLLGILTMARVPADMLSEDCILVDQPSVTIDEQAIYQELFDPHSLVEIELHMSKEQVADIQREYEYYRQVGAKSTTYRIADSVTFTINGKKYVIEEVGVRMKGAKSRCNFYNDVLGVYNLTNLLISFNQTFDDTNEYGLETRVWNSKQERKKRENRTFATLQTMELKWNQTADNTYVRNSYVHEVFRSNGIPAQQCRLTTLSIRGCKMGIFRLFEPVDETFIRRYFLPRDWGGDLYKAKGTETSLATFRPYTTYGVVKKDKSEYYNYDLHTNILTSEHESLRHLIEVVNRPQVTREELDSVIDTDWLSRFTAINFAMGNMDDLRCNYNNYFVYFRGSDGKAVFIPYDCEIVMGAIYSWNTPGRGLTEVSPYFTSHFEFSIEQDNPIMLQVILPDGYYNDQYNAFLRDIVQSKWFRPATFEAYYRPIAVNYSDKVISKYNYMSTIHMNLDFSMEGGPAYNGNLSIAEFMEKMKQNIERNVPRLRRNREPCRGEFACGIQNRKKRLFRREQPLFRFTR